MLRQKETHVEEGPGPISEVTTGEQLSAPAEDARGKSRSAFKKDTTIWDFKSRGEPFVWGLGAALAIGIIMIVGFLALILYNGALTFYPLQIDAVTLKSGAKIAGQLSRSEVFKISPELIQGLPEEVRDRIKKDSWLVTRYLYKIGNFDLYNEDFKWISDYEIKSVTNPPDLYYIERLEWGPFIGSIKSLNLGGKIVTGAELTPQKLAAALADSQGRRDCILGIQRKDIAVVNHNLEKNRLNLKKVSLRKGSESSEYREAAARFKIQGEALEDQYQTLAGEASIIKAKDSEYRILLADINGKEKEIKLSEIVRMFPANVLTVTQKIGVYFSRWWEFLTAEPREANTEGGVMPAIFGTFVMTVLMALAVAPFGVMAALYLREYAKQGRLVSLVRICVNNLAGVPSIVYGVFGLGFFAYFLGGNIDRVFFPERLPTPTFGTGGLLWASLTLALLTVPVVIVATEEALAAVPKSLREGSLACGASKWQTIKYIVLPRAMPGIMTGLILAMARGAGEVAPLMLVGVVKMAPELPIDQFFPYIHLERSFMHLGFHIFDVGFQSRNSEAAKPMVFVTTLLLISLVFIMNIASIMIRNRLKRKFFAGHF